MVGIDLSDKAVDFCNQNYAIDALSFRQGDAENLPLSDASVDVVVNLESSHCYGSMDRFLSEVYRVLRPGGIFCSRIIATPTKLRCCTSSSKNAVLVRRKRQTSLPMW